MLENMIISNEAIKTMLSIILFWENRISGDEFRRFFLDSFDVSKQLHYRKSGWGKETEIGVKVKRRKR